MELYQNLAVTLINLYKVIDFVVVVAFFFFFSREMGLRDIIWYLKN